MAAAVALAVLLSGCGVPGFPEPRATAVPVDAMVCTDALAFSGTVPAGVVPHDVEIAAVLRCDDGMSVGADPAEEPTVAVDRFEGDLDAVLAALSAPNEPKWYGACSLEMIFRPDLWAEDVDGRFFRLSVPSTGCGQPVLDEIYAAFDQIQPVKRIESRAGVLGSNDALSSGCAAQAAVITLALPEDASSDVSLPELAAVDEVGKLRVCVYETVDPSGPAPGIFTSTRELRTPDARTAVGTIASAAPYAETCTTMATRFAVAHPITTRNSLSAPFVVELDGCRRAIDAALRPRVATTELVGLLSP